MNESEGASASINPVSEIKSYFRAASSEIESISLTDRLYLINIEKFRGKPLSAAAG